MGRIFKERTPVDEALRLFLENISTLRNTEEVTFLNPKGCRDGELTCRSPKKSKVNLL